MMVVMIVVDHTALRGIVMLEQAVLIRWIFSVVIASWLRLTCSSVAGGCWCGSRSSTSITVVALVGSVADLVLDHVPTCCGCRGIASNAWYFSCFFLVYLLKISLAIEISSDTVIDSHHPTVWDCWGVGGTFTLLVICGRLLLVVACVCVGLILGCRPADNLVLICCGLVVTHVWCLVVWGDLSMIMLLKFV